MTKPELVKVIMEKTTVYKKTHLMDKHKAELETILAALSGADETATPEADTQVPADRPEIADEKAVSAQGDDYSPENATNTPGEPSGNSAPCLPVTDGGMGDVREAVQTAYEENRKIVKGRRFDKQEFMDTAIETALARVIASGIADTDTIRALTLSVMQEQLDDLVAFVPMNDNEKKMLETIPRLSDYMGAESQVNGMNFLKTVKELHNIEISTSRALMVSLKRKKYITIGGGKKTYIVLLERGVRHLKKAI